MEKNKGKIIEKMKDYKGITLLALAVTIVVLLILTSIGIKLALGNNGIIGEAKNAKEQAEIDEEKGIVKRATTVSLIRSKGSQVEQDTLEKALNDETGEGKTEVSDVGDVFEIVFIDSNRYYEVDREGNISDVNEIIKDNYAGDITKGGRCDGSEEKPYEISCIEDLVVLSNITNGTGIKLENGVAVNITKGDTLEGKYIVLTRDLNFKSKYSYDNYSRTDFGNLNNDDTDGNMLMTEMTTGTGWIPIGQYQGNFDGKEHTIANIYINAAADDKEAKALFRVMMTNTVISNLTVTGKINSNWHAAGIAAGTEGGRMVGIISNCINKVDIAGYNMIGGIAANYIKCINNCMNYGTLSSTGAAYGYAGIGGIIGVTNNNGDEVEIDNCINYGKISGTYHLGGIAGTSSGDTIIKNCKNKGNVNDTSGTATVGGILGLQRGGNLNMVNCCNEGKVIGKNEAGGIVGAVGGASWDSILNTYIQECYNIGSVVSENNAGGIVGTQGTISANNNLYIYNLWNLGTIKGEKNKGEILSTIYTSTRTVTKTEFENVYCTDTAIGIGTLTNGEATLKSVSEIKSESFVDLLNSNIGTNTDWKRWKLGEDGYPTFED